MSTDATPHMRASRRATLVLPAPMKPTKNTGRESAMGSTRLGAVRGAEPLRRPPAWQARRAEPVEAPLPCEEERAIIAPSSSAAACRRGSTP